MKYRFFTFGGLLFPALLACSGDSGSSAGTTSSSSSGIPSESSSSGGSGGTGGVGGSGGSGAGGSGTGGASTSSSSASGGTGGMGGEGVVPWSKHFGSPADDYAWGVAASANGDTTIQFTFTQAMDFGGGPVTPSGRNVGLARFDNSGSYLWAKHFPKTTDADPRLVLDDGLGNLFLTGALEGNFDNQTFGGPPFPQDCGPYLVKLDGSGTFVWSKLYPTCSGGMTDAAFDAAHNLVFIGSLQGTIDYGSGPVSSAGSDDVVVAKIDDDGNGVWAKTFGDTKNQIGSGIAADSQQNIAIVGANQGTIDFGGGAISTVSISGSWVAKLDKNGSHIWSRGLNNTQANQMGVSAYAIAADSQGDTIVSGVFSGACDFGSGAKSATNAWDGFMAKYDPAGALTWVNTFGSTLGTGPAGGHAIEVEPGGDLLLNAALYGATDFGCGTITGSDGGDTAVVLFSTNGTCLWSKAITTSSPSLVTGTANVSMRLDPAANAAVYGIFGGTITFDPAFGGALYTEQDPGAQHADLFLMKFTP